MATVVSTDSATTISRVALRKRTFSTIAVKVIEIDGHRVIPSTTRSGCGTPPPGATTVIVTETSTNDFGVVMIEVIIAHSAPLTVVVVLDPAFVSVAPSGEPDVPRGWTATNSNVFMVAAIVPTDCAGHGTAVPQVATLVHSSLRPRATHIIEMNIPSPPTARSGCATPPVSSSISVELEPKLRAHNLGIVVIEPIIAHRAPAPVVVVLQTASIAASPAPLADESNVTVTMRLATREINVFVMTAIVTPPVSAMSQAALCAMALYVI